MNMEFKNYLDNINKYLSLIVIIPALLGGLWQIVELSSISFSFIRFFSVTQIIPDGLLILLFILIFSIPSLVLVFMIKRYQIKDNSENEEKKGEENKIYGILFVLLFIACCIGFFFFNKYVIDNIDDFIILVIFFPVNILICLTAYSSHKKALNEFRSSISSPISEMFYEIVKVIFQFACVVVFIFLIVRFHEVFFLPNKLRNIENLICKVEKIEPNSSFDILYSNDKYIFVKIDYPSKSLVNGIYNFNEIRIFKFDDLLDDTSCIGSEKIRDQFVKDAITEWGKPKLIR